MPDIQISSLKKFLSFPPPRFLEMPAAGVNISDHSIKIVMIPSANPEKIIAEKVYIDSDVVVSGEIKKPKEVAHVLSNFRKKYGLEFVRLSIPEEKGYIFNLQLPEVKQGDLRDAIHYQIPQHVPLKADEVVFDYDIVPRSQSNGKQSASVSVLPHAIVDQYLELCREAKLQPLSFEIEAQATTRALVPERDTTTRIIVDIGKTRTGISIATGHIVRYTSTAEMGGDSLTHAIEKHMHVEVDEADTLKQDIGFTKTQENDDLYLALANALSALRDEINKRIIYWNQTGKQPGDENIQGVVICGGNASVPGVREYLETSLGLSTELGDVWTNVFSIEEHIPPIPFRQSLLYAPSIGLAISSE